MENSIRVGGVAGESAVADNGRAVAGFIIAIVAARCHMRRFTMPAVRFCSQKGQESNSIAIDNHAHSNERIETQNKK